MTKELSDLKSELRGKMNALVLGTSLLAKASDGMLPSEIEKLLVQFSEWAARVDAQNKAAKVYR